MATDMSVFMQFLRSMLLPLPGITEKMHFEDPAFYVNGKMFANVKLDEGFLAIHTLEREEWMERDPHTFFITRHFLNYKYMLIRLETVSPDDVKTLLITAYLTRATKKLAREFEAMQAEG